MKLSFVTQDQAKYRRDTTCGPLERRYAFLRNELTGFLYEWHGRGNSSMNARSANGYALDDSCWQFTRPAISLLFNLRITEASQEKTTDYCAGRVRECVRAVLPRSAGTTGQCRR